MEMNQHNINNKLRYLLLFAAAIFLIVINFFYFLEKASSNDELIVNFAKEEDPMEKYRNPAIVGAFYDRDSDIAKILLLPDDKNAEAAKIVANYRGKIKTAIVFVASKMVNNDRFEIFAAAEPRFNQEILPAKKQLINIDRKYHLPIFDSLVPEVDLFYVVYGDINPQDMAEEFVPLLSQDDIALFAIGDLSEHFAEPKREDIGINCVLILSQKNGLRPEVISLIGKNSDVLKNSQQRLSKIEQQSKNLQSFAKNYRKKLHQIAVLALEAADKGVKFRPSREKFEDVFFNKGVSFVSLYHDGVLCSQIGSVAARQAIAIDVVKNVFQAYKICGAKDKTGYKVVVSLLTDYEKISYKNEEDLLQKINSEVDGIVIRDGNRQALFLPMMWRQFADKREFWNNLKIKAGMSPSHWSKSINVYRFRTVEISDDN